MLREIIVSIIRRKMKELEMSINRLSELVDLDKKTLYGFLNEGKDIRMSSLEKILSALGITEEDLRIEPEREIPEGYTALEVFSSVSAGNGIEFVERVDTKVFPIEVRREEVKALLVRGDSMYPALVDGSVILVDTQNHTLQHGKMYVFYIPYKGISVKRVLYISNDKLLLKADNEAYGEFCFTKAEMRAGGLQVVGKVVASWQVY